MSSSQAEEGRDHSKQTLRLYINSGGSKTYLLGHHWGSLGMNQKIAMVEAARRGALKLEAVMTLPAEIYVRELDRMFSENPSLRKLEVGPAIHGIAVSFNDWDDGSDHSSP